MTTRTYLVTGGASGIAAEATDRLVTAGHDVIVLDRAAPARRDVTYIPVDMGDPASIDQAVTALPERLHGLANVAGVSGVAGAGLTLRVNFLGLRHLTLAVLDKLEPGSGIVNVASRAGHQWPLRLTQHLELAKTPDFTSGLAWLAEHPVTDNNGYPYSKEILRVWTQLIAPGLLDRGLRINVINPGPVETPIFREFKQLLGEERVQDGVNRAGRPANPTDIAPVITFLLSANAQWINGADIAVDGGLAASYLDTPIGQQPGIQTSGSPVAG